MNETTVVTRRVTTHLRKDVAVGRRKVSMRVRAVTALLAAVLVISLSGIMEAGRLTSFTEVSFVSV